MKRLILSALLLLGACSSSTTSPLAPRPCVESPRLPGCPASGTLQEGVAVRL